MKKIIISLDNLDASNSQKVVQGIKYFSLKNKTTDIFVVGSQKHILTLENKNHISLVFSHLEGEEEKEGLDKFTLSLALDTLKEKEGDALISFFNKKDLYELTKDRIKDISFPFYLTRFLSGITSRYSFLADSGLNDYISSSDFVKILEQSKEFISNVFLIKSPTFSIATSVEERKYLSLVEQELFGEINSFEGFNGLASPFSITRGKSDLYLINASQSEFFIQGIKGMHLAYKEKYDKYIKDDFFAKMSSFFGRKMNKFVLGHTNSNINRLGSFLLGKEKLIVQGDLEASTNDILNMLLDTKKYLDHLNLVENQAKQLKKNN